MSSPTMTSPSDAARPAAMNSAERTQPHDGPRRCQAIWGSTPCHARLASDNDTDFCQVCRSQAEELAQAMAHRERIRERLDNGAPRRVIPIGRIVELTGHGDKQARRSGFATQKAYREHRAADERALEQILRGAE